MQSFVAAQAAHKRDARSERVVGLHATNLETSAEAARERWGEARGGCRRKQLPIRMRTSSGCQRGAAQSRHRTGQ